MSKNKHQQDKKIDKIRRLYGGTQGGIYRHTTREKMVTKEGISQKGRKKDQFWYRQRETVKTTLLDLQLFIEEAARQDVNRVITRESLKPIVNSLLRHIFVITEHTKEDKSLKVIPDLNRAKIAQLLIEEGLSYLRGVFIASKQDIPLSSQRTIVEAIDLSKYLVYQVESLKKEAIEWNIKLSAPEKGVKSNE